MTVSTFQKGFFTISTPEEYDIILSECCVGDGEDICGIPRHQRFERLTSEEAQALSAWFLENGTVVNLHIDNVEFALHLLGAIEVDPSKRPFNLTLGKGKEVTYYWCERNQHNRRLKLNNLGSMTKEGLIYDMVNSYFVAGPAAHVDAFGWILSVQHRIIAWLKGCAEKGSILPAIDIITILGMPPQLAATLDRGAMKTGQDQEFIDRDQFTQEFLNSQLEYVPQDVEKLRNDLAGYLFTVRNNLHSRIHGKGYHPSKPDSPSIRQALELQERFEQVPHGDALQALIVRVHAASLKDDGSKTLWVKYISVPMACTMIVLASNRVDCPEEGDTIPIDEGIADQILGWLGKCSDTGQEGYSSYLREIAKVKAQTKKPPTLERFVFWGFLIATSHLLDGEELPEKCFASESEQKKVKAKKLGHPVMGGLDQGAQETDAE